MTDINDVTHERQVADLPEARRLIHAICDAMWAYRDFLADHGLIWKDLHGLADGENPCKVKKLVAEISYDSSGLGGEAVPSSLSAARLTALIVINRSTRRETRNQLIERRARRTFLHPSVQPATRAKQITRARGRRLFQAKAKGPGVVKHRGQARDRLGTGNEDVTAIDAVIV
jgi:hypothetical protein